MYPLCLKFTNRDTNPLYIIGPPGYGCSKLVQCHQRSHLRLGWERSHLAAPSYVSCVAYKHAKWSHMLYHRVLPWYHGIRCIRVDFDNTCSKSVNKDHPKQVPIVKYVSKYPEHASGPVKPPKKIERTVICYSVCTRCPFQPSWKL